MIKEDEDGIPTVLSICENCGKQYRVSRDFAHCCGMTCYVDMKTQLIIKNIIGQENPYSEEVFDNLNAEVEAIVIDAYYEGQMSSDRD